MKKIGIVICNYNKQDYIIRCIESVFASTIQDFDVYVVDNASTDASVKTIEEAFGSKVQMIVNKENLGGSGGFHVGVEKALEMGYPYIMCVDNDIIMAPNNIEKLYDYMEQHREIGMLGSRVMYMDKPERIQAMGAIIDFEKYTYQDYFRNYLYDETIPQVTECDYVPANSMMLRREAIEKAGNIPKDNFIYWDDMEWGYLIKKAGYMVQCYAEAVVWHKANFKSTSTFGKYYMWRNRLAFFMKYLPHEKREDFSKKILTELFHMIYGCNYKGEYNLIKTLMYAYDDALHGIRGKATDNKIMQREIVEHKIDLKFKDKEKVNIIANEDIDALEEIIKRLTDINPDMQICVLTSKDDELFVRKQFPQVQVVTTATFQVLSHDETLVMCSHVFDVEQPSVEGMYVDKWCNLIDTEEDYHYCSSFRVNKELFLRCRMSVLMECMNKQYGFV